MFFGIFFYTLQGESTQFTKHQSIVSFYLFCLIFNGAHFQWPVLYKKKPNCFTSVKVHSYQTQKTEFPLKRMGLNFQIFQRGTLFCIIFLCLKNTSCICNFSCTLYVIFYVPKTSIMLFNMLLVCIKLFSQFCICLGWGKGVGLGVAPDLQLFSQISQGFRKIHIKITNIQIKNMRKNFVLH